MLSVLVLSSVAGFSQQDESLIPPKVLFKISPQHFAINTLKVSAEFFNKDKNKSVSIFAYGRFDADTNSEPYYYGDARYKGLGGEIQYRKYISPIRAFTTRRNRNYLQGIYVGGYAQGASYANNGEFVNYSFDPNTKQYVQSTGTINESIGNWGTGFTIGVHRTIWSVLFIDVYVGGGIQWSDIIRTVTPPTSNNSDYYYYGGIISPGYQGVMPKFGLLLGVAL